MLNVRHKHEKAFWCLVLGAGLLWICKNAETAGWEFWALFALAMTLVRALVGERR